MNFRKFIDYVQIRLHLLGWHRAATFLGRWGSPQSTTPPNVHERDTVPDLNQHLIDSTRSGEGWSLDEMPAHPLVAVNFDPTFSSNRTVDMTQVAFPSDRLSVN